MARFNTKKITGPTTVNDAGGTAYTQSPELELVSLLLTSFASDGYYQKASDQLTRLEELIGKVDPEFAAKALVFARDEFGMRSITHAGAAILSKRASGQPWATAFYDAIVVRPDDMTETISFAKNFNHKVTNALKRGFAKAFDRFGPYQLSKYRGEGKGVKLVDVVNLVHPVPTERNGEALKALVAGTLRVDDTWEAMLSAAGSDEKKKAAVWQNLLSENKLGYFALLRNLRNIAQQAPEALPLALSQLKDPERIKRSRVLPFRYQTAYGELMGIGLKQEKAINEAAEIALQNVPVLPGSTLVALDTSGSMSGGMFGLRGGNKSPIQIGSLFAAILAQRNNADLRTFDTVYRKVSVERMGVLPFSRQMKTPGGGTDFNQIFKDLGEKYDRIIILSDMQAWVGQTGHYHSHYTADAMKALAEYKARTGADPMIWSFDLAHAGSMQFPEAKTRCVAGFSEKVFSIMEKLEEDPQAMVNHIKSYAFTGKAEEVAAD
jgi:60 kDa SS-A/Ro ribonucleoprotein